MSTHTYLAQQFVTRKANLMETQHFVVQRNLSVTTASKIKFITCDLFSNVF